MTTNLKWFAALMLLVASFVAGIITGREQIQSKWDLYKLDIANKSLEASDEYRAKELEFDKQLQEARIESNQRKKDADDAINKWRVANSQLRDLNADISGRLSKSTIEACNRVVSTYGDILNHCDEEQSRMARAADECATAYIELDKSWPN